MKSVPELQLTSFKVMPEILPLHEAWSQVCWCWLWQHELATILTRNFRRIVPYHSQEGAALKKLQLYYYLCTFVNVLPTTPILPYRNLLLAWNKSLPVPKSFHFWCPLVLSLLCPCSLGCCPTVWMLPISVSWQIRRLINSKNVNN